MDKWEIGSREQAIHEICLVLLTHVCRSSGRRFSSRNPSSFGFGRRLLRCPCMSAPPAKCWVAERREPKASQSFRPRFACGIWRRTGGESDETTAHSICLPGLGVWPARLLVWMFQLHLDQSRALHGLDPQVFIGPSVVVLPLSCNYETIGSNVPAMQWTAHSSLRWLPAGIWSHCGGREVGSREPGFNGETVNLSHKKERILATDISFSPTNGSHDKLPVDH